MKADDTFLKNEQIDAMMKREISPDAKYTLLPPDVRDLTVYIREDQSRASFQAGIQEAVNWLKDNSSHCTMGTLGYEVIESYRWQNQLRAWGIK